MEYGRSGTLRSPILRQGLYTDAGSSQATRFFLVLWNPACLGECIWTVSAACTPGQYRGHITTSLWRCCWAGPSDSSALDLTSFLWVKDGLLLLGLLPLILFLTPGDCKNLTTTEPRELSGIILFSPAWDRPTLKVLESCIIILSKPLADPDLSTDFPGKGFRTSVILNLVGMGRGEHSV